MIFGSCNDRVVFVEEFPIVGIIRGTRRTLFRGAGSAGNRYRGRGPVGAEPEDVHEGGAERRGRAQTGQHAWSSRFPPKLPACFIHLSSASIFLALSRPYARTIKSAIGTLVERTTRYAVLVHLPTDDGAELVRDGLVKAMTALPENLRGSLTCDQGSETASHKSFGVTTDWNVCFCDPASPSQCDSNENTNGLQRQYFPKGPKWNAVSYNPAPPRLGVSVMLSCWQPVASDRELCIRVFGVDAGRTDPGKPFDDKQADRGAGPVPAQRFRSCGTNDGAQDKGDDDYVVGAPDHGEEIRDEIER